MERTGLNPLSPAASVYYIENTDSTMAEARRLVESSKKNAAQPIASGTVIRAGFQTAGRGRIEGRRWTAAAGESLLFTVIFTAEDLKKKMNGKSFTLLPLLCGLAVAESIEYFSSETAAAPDIRIKWPNDVLADGRKICGILCESSGEYIYAGMGINISQTEFPADLRRPAGSVRMLTGKRIDAVSVLEHILSVLPQVLANEQWREEVQKRLLRINEQVSVLKGLAEEISPAGQEVIKGVLKGVSSSGAMLIETSEGLIPVSNGELLI